MTTWEIARQYLMDYLTEEFSRYPIARLRVQITSEDDGIALKTEAREYFFPTLWAASGDMKSVERLVRDIKAVLDK